MPAYLLANITVTDPERYREYMAVAGPAVAKYGGRYLVRGPQPEPLEEDWALARVAIIEFPDEEAVRTWYRSPEYQAARLKRAGAATARLVILPGVAS